MIIESFFLCFVHLNGSVNCVPLQGAFEDEPNEEQHKTYEYCMSSGKAKLLMWQQPKELGEGVIGYFCAPGGAKNGWND